MIKNKFAKIAFIFPGQGAQYVGMGKDFAENFSAARFTFEEADDLLRQSLSPLIFNGPEELLTQTIHSQLAIFITSIAILRVVQELYDLKPAICSGLSLGEYTALVAAEKISFFNALELVKHRGQYMNDACETTQGSMAAVMGLDSEMFGGILKKVNLPNDLWVANYNCPGQIVISGTRKGIEAGSLAAKDAGAKRIIPLQVHGAFHSGLMKEAELKLAPHIKQTSFKDGGAKIVMNVPGDFVFEGEFIQKYLIQQVTHSVCWEQGIKKIDEEIVDFYLEFGPGSTLAGMNKRIGVKAPTFSIKNVEDLAHLSKLAKEGKLG